MYAQLINPNSRCVSNFLESLWVPEEFKSGAIRRLVVYVSQYHDGICSGDSSIESRFDKAEVGSSGSLP
jgi:hypothetical protein